MHLLINRFKNCSCAKDSFGGGRRESQQHAMQFDGGMQEGGAMWNLMCTVFDYMGCDLRYVCYYYNYSWRRKMYSFDFPKIEREKTDEDR